MDGTAYVLIIEKMFIIRAFLATFVEYSLFNAEKSMPKRWISNSSNVCKSTARGK